MDTFFHFTNKERTLSEVILLQGTEISEDADYGVHDEVNIHGHRFTVWGIITTEDERNIYLLPITRH